MKKLSLFLGIFTLLSADNASAQVQELLMPVTGTDVAEARTKNVYFLKKHLYSARRHRIVRVNVDVLQSREPFEISLFNNKSITVEPINVEVQGEGAIILWFGKIANPPLSIDEMMSEMGSQKEAQLTHDALYGVTIAAARYEHDEEFDANFTYYTKKENPHQRTRLNDSEPAADRLFYGLSANLKASGIGGRFQLRPLEMGGDFHVLYEIDHSKIVDPGPLDDPENPEMAQKRRDWQEFADSLGPDPRIPMQQARRERAQ